MENQINVGDQNTQQIGQNPISQPVQIPEKPRVNNRPILTTIFGVPVLTYILFQISGYPLSSVLIPILFGDTSNAGLGGLAILMVITIILAIFFALLCGLLIYILTKKIKFLFVGFGIFMLIFAVHRTVIKISSEKYLRTEVSTALKNVYDAVGKEKMTLTYISSAPLYDNEGVLDKVEVTFNVVAPESGEYTLYFSLRTPVPKDQQVSKIYVNYKKEKLNLTEGVPFEVITSFEMKSFVEENYEGELKVDPEVWRTGIKKQDVAWHTNPITEWPVNIVDSGASSNFEISNSTGVEEPIYSVGPFYISRQ